MVFLILELDRREIPCIRQPAGLNQKDALGNNREDLLHAAVTLIET
jgi:hypothetical protein